MTLSHLHACMFIDKLRIEGYSHNITYNMNKVLKRRVEGYLHYITYNTDKLLKRGIKSHNFVSSLDLP